MALNPIEGLVKGDRCSQDIAFSNRIPRVPV